ncbi:MAG: hypothetical protein ACTSUE_22645 [Promethearchaeota archaeon]
MNEKTTKFDYNVLDGYQVFCGVEEEFLLVDKNGSLVNAADDVMVKAAEILERDEALLDTLKVKVSGLDAEPSLAQIEYVSLPLPPENIRDAIKSGRHLLLESTKQLGIKLLARSLHPIQSDPNPIAGTHINVSVKRNGSLMKPEEMKSIYNHLWSLLPEIIALSANSSVYRGQNNKIASNRYANSRVLKYNNLASLELPDHQPALVPMRYYGRMRYKLKIGIDEDDFSKKVIANKKGDRLMDISPRGPFTNISGDKDDSPTRNRVEVRAIDVQNDIEELVEITLFCCISALQALVVEQSPDYAIDMTSLHKRNIEAAVTDGIEATFVRGGGARETARESMKRWHRETKPIQEMTGLESSIVSENGMLSTRVHESFTIQYHTESFEIARRKGNVYAVVQIRNPRIVEDKRGNKYKVAANAKLNGMLSADYKLIYDEKNNCIQRFKSIEVLNSLDVQGLKIPLEREDRLLRTFSKSDYAINQLLGGFGF